MEKWTSLAAIAAPLLKINIETGLLAPSFVSKPGADAWGERLFAAWRYDEAGADNPDFVLNQPRYKDAQILLAGRNFGCGSSRETAVWTLAGYGFRCVIAPTFGEIFYDNAFQNGLLLIELPEETIAAMAGTLETANRPELVIDLESQIITLPGGRTVAFAIPPERRTALLEGLDELSVLRRHQDAVARFREGDEKARPWVYRA